MIDPKIQSPHLGRKACVYVRQSTSTQIMQHQESTERQYKLAERALELGWPPTSIEVIDEDQGRSGRTAEHRSGFQRLMTEVSMGQVGVVLMLEASRLARNNSDWHRLIEICGLSRTLIADGGTVYDPREPNDRLLLGVKGTLSEAELFTLRTRLYEGRWNKARKGRLQMTLPVGYVAGSGGGWELDPDLQVRERLRFIFEAFGRLGVARRVVYELKRLGLEVPTRSTRKEGYGALVWKAPTLSAVIRILTNPAYAGAYTYGRWSYTGSRRSKKNGKVLARPLPMEEWPVCLRDHHPAYLSWEQYVKNRQRLRENWNQDMSRGAAGEGAALLQGIVYCGLCGRKMSIQNRAAREKRSPSYVCQRGYFDGDRHICQSMTARPVDAGVVAAFLEAISPTRLEVAMRVAAEVEQNLAAQRRQWELQLEQARYEARAAQRKYDAVDADNRLVAAELERRWNEKLERVARLEQGYQQAEQDLNWNLSAEERVAIGELSADLPAVWAAATTTNRERKELLRFAIETVQLDGVTRPGEIEVQIYWRSGVVTRLSVTRSARGEGSLKTPEAAVALIQEMAPGSGYEEIAEELNARGLRTAFGRRFTVQHVGYVCRRDGLGRGRPQGEGRDRK
jgi:DNA invertase Pin-like site-specific DNA recombinase